VRWLRVNHQALAIDPNRIVASGGSAGGHLAACTALTPDIVGKGEDPGISSQTCAMVLFNPVVSVIGAERVHGDFTERLLSPILYLKAGGPPAVLFFGSKDKLLAGGREFANRSKELGIRADLHVTAGQDHGFFNDPPFRGQTQQVADEFLVSLGLLKGEASRPQKKRG
jgi:acetyl esterase/lipase